MKLAFQQKWHLKRQKDFKRTLESGSRQGDGHIVIYIMTNDLDCARLGVRVSRRLGNAVRRNGIKRTIREAFRIHQIGARYPGYDVVCLPRPGPRRSLEAYGESLIRLIEGGIHVLQRPRRAPRKDQRNRQDA